MLLRCQGNLPSCMRITGAQAELPFRSRRPERRGTVNKVSSRPVGAEIVFAIVTAQGRSGYDDISERPVLRHVEMMLSLSLLPEAIPGVRAAERNSSPRHEKKNSYIGEKLWIRWKDMMKRVRYPTKPVVSARTCRR